jgi:hypothetical protein
MVADNWSIRILPKQLHTDFGKPRFAIKLCQPLKNLNPNDRARIRLDASRRSPTWGQPQLTIDQDVFVCCTRFLRMYFIASPEGSTIRFA